MLVNAMYWDPGSSSFLKVFVFLSSFIVYLENVYQYFKPLIGRVKHVYCQFSRSIKRQGKDWERYMRKRDCERRGGQCRRDLLMKYQVRGYPRMNL